MQLTDEQKRAVTGWISEGLTLAQIQDRMGKEMDLRMTYMEARMLVDDLKLLPKETVVEAPKPSPTENPVPAHDGSASEGGGAAQDGEGGAPVGSQEAQGAGVPGEVKVKVDTLTRPGAMVSGSVTFSDGQSAGWYLSTMGQLGMVPPSPGYRPPHGEIQTFQMLLENELAKMGM